MESRLDTNDWRSHERYSPSSAGTERRAQPESFRARGLTASLTVKDIEKSLAWYRDAVGFTVSQQHTRDGRVVAISLKAGSVELC